MNSVFTSGLDVRPEQAVAAAGADVERHCISHGEQLARVSEEGRDPGPLCAVDGGSVRKRTAFDECDFVADELGIDDPGPQDLESFGVDAGFGLDPPLTCMKVGCPTLELFSRCRHWTPTLKAIEFSDPVKNSNRRDNGNSYYRPNDLRYTWASSLLKEGVNPAAVAK